MTSQELYQELEKTAERNDTKAILALNKNNYTSASFCTGFSTGIRFVINLLNLQAKLLEVKDEK